MEKKIGLGRVAVYYRVSTEKQDLDSQVQAVEAWLADLPEEKRPKKVTVYKDEGISGTTMKRPGFQEMLDHAYSQKVDTIVCYRLDRFSRNATTAIKLLLNMDEVGVAFVSVTQPMLNLGHDFPFRRMLLAAFAEIAEIERETIVTRVKAGLEAARKRGVKLGAPTKIDGTKQRMILDLREEGKSMKQIAKEMEISVGSVHRMIKAAQNPDHEVNK